MSTYDSYSDLKLSPHNVRQRQVNRRTMRWVRMFQVQNMSRVPTTRLPEKGHSYLPTIVDKMSVGVAGVTGVTGVTDGRVTRSVRGKVEQGDLSLYAEEGPRRLRRVSRNKKGSVRKDPQLPSAAAVEDMCNGLEGRLRKSSRNSRTSVKSVRIDDQPPGIMDGRVEGFENLERRISRNSRVRIDSGDQIGFPGLVDDVFDGVENGSRSSRVRIDHGDQAGYPDVKFDGSIEDMTMDIEPPLIKPYKGMAKEDLLQHSSKPFWRRLRMACVSVIILGWLALLITVVAIVIVYPRCRQADDTSWWQKEVIYRIYVRSFYDSDGDGIGDLKGVKSKLGYIQSLGFNVISLSSVYVSDGVDADFNIIDHQDIDPDYGDMSDFLSLLEAVRERNMYILLDFIPNHTSDQHPWFRNSTLSSNRSNDFRNYYVWANTLNNWRTVYNNASWTRSFSRNQFYLHQFLGSQPDLNLRSSQVQKALEIIFRYWLILGVDGFYIRNTGFLFEDFDMRNEKPMQSPANSTTEEDYDHFEHEFTYGLPEVYDMIARWRAMAEEHSNHTGKLLIADTRATARHAMDLYGHFDRDGVHLSLNKMFLGQEGACGARCLHGYVNTWLKYLPSGRWANWMISDDQSVRAASRLNSSFIRLFTLATMLLPGTPVVYYGDEILMEDDAVVGLDPWKRRQTMRGLMQWNNSTNGGFQKCHVVGSAKCREPWIPSDGGFMYTNVQDAQRKTDSLLNLIRKLTTLRREQTFQIGEFQWCVVDDDILSFTREFDGISGYLVVINLGETEETRDYKSGHETMSSSATVMLTSGSDVSYAPDDTVKTTSLKLGPRQGVVLVWDFIPKEL